MNENKFYLQNIDFMKIKLKIKKVYKKLACIFQRQFPRGYTPVKC